MNDNLEQWANRLGSESMPIFSRTIECVAGMAETDSSSFSQLACSILQDPSLTAQVLKLSNSIYYNPAGRRIQTVSRAVMRLGFDVIRAICMSACLIGTAQIGKHHERVTLELARAFHAAVQAKEIAIKLKVHQPEEVYVAALLSRMGQIAFWCFAGEVGDQLEEAFKSEEGELTEAQVEMQVLGFRLERLTLRLAQEWRFSSLLESMLENPNSKKPEEQSARMGYSLAQVCEKGWDSPEFRKVIKKISECLNITEQEAVKNIHSASRNAADITATFGAMESSRLIPLPEIPPPEPVHEEEEPKEYPKTDYQIQMASLRDLASMSSSRRGDMNSILSVLLEGIYRGIGMDRVIFALLTPDRKFVAGKYALGWRSETAIQGFRISVDGSHNLFAHVLRSQKAIWVNEDPDPDIFSMLTKEISDNVGGGPFFVMPISIRGQSIGVICTDRNLSGRELDDESFESFSFFGQQGNVGLTALTGP